MIEWRDGIAPPEMTNGSRSGSDRSNSSARAIRIGYEVEKMKLATTPRELAPSLALEHRGNETVARIEDERVQRSLCARPVGRGILLERQLKEGVQLDGGAAARCVFNNLAAGMDVAGATEGRADGRAGGRAVQNTKVAIAQLRTSIGDAGFRVKKSIENHKRIRTARRLHHFGLEVVVEARVHQLHRQPHVGVGTNA